MPDRHRRQRGWWRTPPATRTGAHAGTVVQASADHMAWPEPEPIPINKLHISLKRQLLGTGRETACICDDDKLRVGQAVATICPEHIENGRFIDQTSIVGRMFDLNHCGR